VTCLEIEKFEQLATVGYLQQKKKYVLGNKIFIYII